MTQPAATPASPRPSHWGARLQQRWQALPQREQRWAGVGLALLALLLCAAAVVPAASRLRELAQRQPQLDAQTQRMHALAAQARRLQALPKSSPEESLQALESALRQHLGATAQLQRAGERVVVTLKACPAEALAQWLTQVRLNARLLPSEAQLERNGSQWSGSLVLVLPPSP